MTTIEWTDETWNPVRGCALVSAGCANCYAMKQAHRFSGDGMPYEGLTKLGPHGPIWTGKITLVPEVLDAPLRWKKPRRIFVNSMSDLFHEYVTRDYIDAVWSTMAEARQHTFQILTKRPQRMMEFMKDRKRKGWKADWQNVWLGVSIEDQATADERISILLQTPAAVRFVSAEPLLGPVQLGCGDEFFDYGVGRNEDNEPRIHWVIVGGESGPGSRPCDLAWIRSIVEQCRAAAVPCFVKQLGAKPVEYCCDGQHPEIGLNDRKGGDPTEWPADLRVREWPR